MLGRLHVPGQLIRTVGAFLPSQRKDFFLRQEMNEAQQQECKHENVSLHLSREIE